MSSSSEAASSLGTGLQHLERLGARSSGIAVQGFPNGARAMPFSTSGALVFGWEFVPGANGRRLFQPHEDKTSI